MKDIWFVINHKSVGIFAIKGQGGNSQNFLHKFVRFFLTLKCFYGVVIHRKKVYFMI